MNKALYLRQKKKSIFLHQWHHLLADVILQVHLFLKNSYFLFGCLWWQTRNTFISCKILYSTVVAHVCLYLETSREEKFMLYKEMRGDSRARRLLESLILTTHPSWQLWAWVLQMVEGAWGGAALHRLQVWWCRSKINKMPSQETGCYHPQWVSWLCKS